MVTFSEGGNAFSASFTNGSGVVSAKRKPDSNDNKVVFNNTITKLHMSVSENDELLHANLSSGSCGCDLSKYALEEDLEKLEDRVVDVEINDGVQDNKMFTMDTRIINLENSTTNLRDITASEIDAMF